MKRSHVNDERHERMILAKSIYRKFFSLIVYSGFCYFLVFFCLFKISLFCYFRYENTLLAWICSVHDGKQSQFGCMRRLTTINLSYRWFYYLFIIDWDQHFYRISIIIMWITEQSQLLGLHFEFLNSHYNYSMIQKAG